MISVCSSHQKFKFKIKADENRQKEKKIAIWVDFSVHNFENGVEEFFEWESLKVHFGDSDSETFAHNVEQFFLTQKNKYINESQRMSRNARLSW